MKSRDTKRKAGEWFWEHMQKTFEGYYALLEHPGLTWSGWNRLSYAAKLGEFDAIELVALSQQFWGEISSQLIGFQTERRISAFHKAYWRPAAIKARRAALFGAKAARNYYDRVWQLLYLLSCNPRGEEFRKQVELSAYKLCPTVPPLPKGAEHLLFSFDPTVPPETIDPDNVRDQEIGKLIRTAWENGETAFFASLLRSAEALHEIYEPKPGPKRKGPYVDKLTPEEKRQRGWTPPPDPRKPGFEVWEWRRPFETGEAPQARTVKWRILRELKDHLSECQTLPSGGRIIKRLYGSDSKKDTQKRHARDELRKMGIP